MLFYKEILWKQRDCSLISFGAESPSPIHRNISFSKIQSLFSEKRQTFYYREKLKPTNHRYPQKYDNDSAVVKNDGISSKQDGEMPKVIRKV